MPWIILAVYLNIILTVEGKAWDNLILENGGSVIKSEPKTREKTYFTATTNKQK